MLFEVQVTVAATRKKTLARIEAATPAEAMERAKRHGLIVAPGAVPRATQADARGRAAPERREPQRWQRPRGPRNITLIIGACAVIAAGGITTAAMWHRKNRVVVGSGPEIGTQTTAKPSGTGSEGVKAANAGSETAVARKGGEDSPAGAKSRPPERETPSSMGEVVAGQAPSKPETGTPDAMAEVVAGGGSAPAGDAAPGGAPPEGQRPSGAPAAAESPKPAKSEISFEDRRAFYAEVSSPYVMNGKAVPPNPDMERLAGLTKSTDEHVADLAAVRLSLLRVNDAASHEADEAQRDSIRQGQAVLREFVGKTLIDALSGEDNDLERAREVMNGDFISGQFELQTRLQMTQVMGEMVMGIIRSSVREAYVAEDSRGEDPEAFKTSGAQLTKLVTVCSSDEHGLGLLIVRNATGKALTNCVITTELEVDPAKFAAWAARKEAGDAPAYLILEVLGVNSKPSRDLEAARMAAVRVDRGQLVFVPTLAPGASVSIAITDATLIRDLGKRLSAWVGCDSGVLAREIPLGTAVSQMRIPAPVKPSVQLPSRAPSKAPSHRYPQPNRNR